MKLGKRPGRAKSKKEKEGTRRGEKWGDTDGSRRRARKEDSRPNYRRKKKERSRREGERIRESKYNIHYRKMATEELPKYLEGRMTVEGQKSISKIQMWKRDQSEGILERRGRKKMQAMQKERRRPGTCNRRMRNNGRTKGHRKNTERDWRRTNRTKNDNREEKGDTRRGGTTIRKHNKEARAQKLL